MTRRPVHVRQVVNAPALPPQPAPRGRQSTGTGQEQQGGQGPTVKPTEPAATATEAPDVPDAAGSEP